MAIDNPSIRVDVIGAQEFPHLARQYGVQSVPKTVINNVVEVNGALETQPELVNKDPHGNWMIVVRLSKPDELNSLIDADAYGELIV